MNNNDNNAIWVLFQQCSNILSIKFNILGINISLWQFIAFDIVVFLLSYWIVELFERK